MKAYVKYWGFVYLLMVASACSSGSNDGCEGAGCDEEYEGEEAPEGSPTGLGEVCRSEDACAEYEADYCVAVPGVGGYCSFKDCTTNSNDCPSGYRCCDYVPEGYPNACLSPAKWAQYSSGLCANAN